MATLASPPRDRLAEMERHIIHAARTAIDIATYTKLHRRPPAEADLQAYFGVTPPSVHNMILTLEKRGLIGRTPGRARSIEVLVPLNELPELA